MADEEEDAVLLYFQMMNAAATAVAVASQTDPNDNAIYSEPTKRGIHSSNPRNQRRKFDHQGALSNMKRDYLGDNPLFGKEFELMFRLSRPRVELMLQDFGNSGIDFYKAKPSANKLPVPSLECRLLLPLKTLAYGVPSHCFCDYFQVSNKFAAEACFEFDKAVKVHYEGEFLRQRLIFE